MVLLTILSEVRVSERKHDNIQPASPLQNQTRKQLIRSLGQTGNSHELFVPLRQKPAKLSRYQLNSLSSKVAMPGDPVLHGWMPSKRSSSCFTRGLSAKQPRWRRLIPRIRCTAMLTPLLTARSRD